MSTTLETVRELLSKIPELPQLIKEAQAPPVTVVSETAWIYNGLEDMTLNHLGLPYLLKRGVTTQISGRPDYWEVDQNRSEGTEIVRQTIPLKGEFIAREMIDLRGYDKMGLMVITTPEPTAAQKKECDDSAMAYIRKHLESFKNNRERARAGTVGYKIVPDPQTYTWMQRYAPDDPMFADQSVKTDSNKQIAEAIALLTRLVTGGSGQAVAITANPVTMPTPTTVNAQESALLPTTDEAPAIPGRPRKKPFESIAEFEKRLAAWESIANPAPPEAF